ncbi:MAG: hypothetical protein K2W96_19565 [Gemmataceae bacterium]|nr:hypothetical protein [Gemmataceae bacterium]
MAHKKQHHAPVPPGNQPAFGPQPGPGQATDDAQQAGGGAPDQEQDPKRRLGDFTGKGEHSFQQPGGKNDANH